MSAFGKLFDGLTLFFVAMAAGYIWLTGASRTGVEWAGATGLVLAAIMCLFVGGYTRFVNNRISVLPEDYEEAEISDGAGELGFFSPGSLWPFLMATAIVFVGYGLAFLNWPLIIIAAVFLVIAVCGLVFQYYWGPEKH